MSYRSTFAIHSIAVCALIYWANSALAAQNTCAAQSADTLTPVVELYTSEGCSSCPPADKWISTLKAAHGHGKVVAQAFHVNYWDYIGWVDRFAAPAHTARQRQIAATNKLGSIYTPQLVRNGMDWRDYDGAARSSEAARAKLDMTQTAANAFEANVTPLETGAAWSAYWTVTEHGHVSRVNAGENKGETLQHDFVVRQYVNAGQYSGAQKIKFNALPADAKYPRQINLVVVDAKTGKPLQALSAGC